MHPITITHITLHPIALPFVEVLRTSFGVEEFKSAIIVELHTADGVIGWGEIVADVRPGYGSETMTTAEHIASEFLLPLLINQTISHPSAILHLFKPVRGHHHTKAGIESAVWDAFAKSNGMSLASLFTASLPDGHASRGVAVVGVSIGIQPSLEATIAIIQKRYDEGYRRIKLKIKRGWDIELARGIRDAMPDISLMLDANSDYTLADADHLAQLDAFHLLMIEQPLADDDIFEHSQLQAYVKTPICLDESMKSAHDLRVALTLGAIDILNLKPARVGGFTQSLMMYQMCAENNLPLWIGGMLETGIGRAQNVALASLPAVTLPCDISATNRYFDPDITEPPFILNPENSTLAVPPGLGIGVEVIPERLEEAKVRWRAHIFS
ncbi:MAG: o-succinylbenzoate synthase [Phototrophicales bacterium]|nr:o-succinylbenzoate synthase [Phototrophicales bacterium]